MYWVNHTCMAKYTAQEEQHEFNSARLVCRAFSTGRRSDVTLLIKCYRSCKSLWNWVTFERAWSALRQRACYFCLGKPELPSSQISNCPKWMTKNWGRKLLLPQEGTCSGGAQLGSHRRGAPVSLWVQEDWQNSMLRQRRCGQLPGEWACTSQCSSPLETLMERSSCWATLPGPLLVRFS